MHDGGRKDRTLRLARIEQSRLRASRVADRTGLYGDGAVGPSPAEGVAAARPLPRQSVLLPGVERRSSVADLRARQAAGRGAANSAAGQGGQRALRASGLQSGRRTCDDRRTNRRHTRTTYEGHARRHGDRSRRRSCRGRLLDRGDGSRGGALGDVGQHLLDAAAHLRTAGYDRDARLVLRGAGRRTGRGARRTAAHAGMAALRRAGADEKGVRGTARRS